MKLFKKMKDILFEEEEVEIPVKEEPKLAEVKEEVVEKETTFAFPKFDEDDFKEELLFRNAYVEEETKTKKEIRETYKDHVRYERVETVEKKKFKPTPIISPVYGVLNKDYTPDDIKNKDEVEKLKVEEVRKKAFEPKKEVPKKEVPKKEEAKEEEVEKLTVEKKTEKVKTIDQLLDEADDIKIDYKEELEDFDNPDTLENDLFDLIDSMYDKKEDV
jgi:hypothetical protein